MNFDILVYDEFHVVVYQHLSVLFNKNVQYMFEALLFPSTWTSRSGQLVLTVLGLLFLYTRNFSPLSVECIETTKKEKWKALSDNICLCSSYNFDFLIIRQNVISYTL